MQRLRDTRLVLLEGGSQPPESLRSVTASCVVSLLLIILWRRGGVLRHYSFLVIISDKLLLSIVYVNTIVLWFSVYCYSFFLMRLGLRPRSVEE
jgi:hypothetical protein